MTKEEQFVNELIGYIFAYPDDDYMTMECLCRKLHKYGLIEKKDGEWTTDFIDRKTEPTISKMEQVDKPQTPYDNCQSCLHWVHDGYWYCECKECRYEPKTEPQTCEECDYWNDTEDGCADRHGCTITERSK